MHATGRVVKDIACGNNCTVLLVGPHRVPPLTELCLEQIAEHWHAYEQFGAFLCVRARLRCMAMHRGSGGLLLRLIRMLSLLPPHTDFDGVLPLELSCLLRRIRERRQSSWAWPEGGPDQAAHAHGTSQQQHH